MVACSEQVAAADGGGEGMLTGIDNRSRVIKSVVEVAELVCPHHIHYELESINVLDSDNETDIFSLHYVYIPRIQQAFVFA